MARMIKIPLYPDSDPISVRPVFPGERAEITLGSSARWTAGADILYPAVSDEVPILVPVELARKIAEAIMKMHRGEPGEWYGEVTVEVTHDDLGYLAVVENADSLECVYLAEDQYG